ncbi:Mu-like prophage protein gp45 [Actinobacillus lignieresii]|uniref:phage baseplate assembly protein V n=1 Tax=Actinobacillus lignieresii TaxID=720 RepID=UPI000F6C7116|nr:phage baseplate assembly protein V [Actinobacillus lignieresii]VEB25775.1 Mu-like prophage protein gp45 [Actinobacillus lignieresii]
MMRKLAKQTRDVAKNVQSGVRSAFRGVLNLVKSSSDIQQVQVSGLADETIQDVEFMQHFGFTSVPPAGTQVVVIPLGGKTTHGIVVATENGSFRVKNLKGGETAIYDSSGSTIILKNGRVIDVECDKFNVNCKQYNVTATDSANFTTPKLETDQQFVAQGKMSGNGGLAVQGGDGASFTGSVVQTGGNFTTDGDVNANGTSLCSHAHNEQGDGKPTSQPI